ncbi:hypothetical protein, partial [Mesorhizobium sp. M4B.F.Ca.ET.089.01.1.1]|uniref:hypothetical protein n=1 Tax=Mesorhizobium sp. M4B.F.Ca.ET.089.01.1.1 TaxID=2496662 RepID=UPI001AECC91D
MLEFFRSASHFAGPLLRRTITIFLSRKSAPAARDRARKAEAAAKPEGRLEPNHADPSAMEMARGEPGGTGYIVERAGVRAGVSGPAYSDVEDMRSAGIPSADAKPIDADGEQSHVLAKAAHGVPGDELA